MKKLCLLFFAAVLFGACGGGAKPNANSEAGPSGLSLKVDGKDLVMPVKSGVMRTSAQEGSTPESSAAIYQFTLANYDLNSGSDLMKTLSRPEDVRVFFKLYGNKGSNKDTPLKPGKYAADVASFPSYDRSSLAIFTFADGKQSVALSQDSPPTDTKGEVKILSVEGDTVKGEIDVTTGSTIAAKGSFTAKVKPLNF